MDVATTTVGVTDLKFRLAREDFADAVAWVARTLPTRPTVPVLAGVLLTGSDDGLTVSGFDYEVSAEVRLAAEIASPGTVLVSGRLLSDITRALPDKPVDVQVEGTTGFTPYVKSGNNTVIAVSLLLLALGFAFGPAFKGKKERTQASTK